MHNALARVTPDHVGAVPPEKQVSGGAVLGLVGSSIFVMSNLIPTKEDSSDAVHVRKIVGVGLGAAMAIGSLLI